jgi:hypothetical protein
MPDVCLHTSVADGDPDVVATAGLTVLIRTDLCGVCGTFCIIGVGPKDLAARLKFVDDHIVR